MTHFRVAVCQAASVGFDAGKSVERLAAMTETAASNGARIAVFPEAFIGGYPKRLDYGVKVGLGLASKKWRAPATIKKKKEVLYGYSIYKRL